MSWFNELTDGLVDKWKAERAKWECQSNHSHSESPRIIQDPKEILNMILPWVAGEKFITMTLPGLNETFVSHFSPQGYDSDLLLRNLGLLVEPLHPLTGNRIIRSTRRAVVHVSNDDRQVRAEVLYCGRVIGRHGHPVLLLGFPHQLWVSGQKRENARVVLGKRSSLNTRLTLPKGGTMVVPAREMGMGGLSFWKPERYTGPVHGHPVRCTLCLPGMSASIEVKGRMLVTRAEAGSPIVRLRFDRLSQKLERQLNSLVTMLRRENLERRQLALQN